jgi:hypothetical protein
MAKRKDHSPAAVRKRIKSLRGTLKLNTNEKPFAEWMSESNREEKVLEEKRFQRLTALGRTNRSHK